MTSTPGPWLSGVSAPRSKTPRWSRADPTRPFSARSKRPCSLLCLNAFRQRTLLPLDDGLYALQASIPHLTRSSLHRCLQRHGLSRLPEVGGDKPAKKKFAKYAIGYFHVDIAEVQTGQGRLYLFVAIDRTSKFAFAELHSNQTRDTACCFLRRLVGAVPYGIHTVLTDNG